MYTKKRLTRRPKRKISRSMSGSHRILLRSKAGDRGCPFEIIEATQADTVMDFTQNRLQKMMKMLNIFHGLEAKTKRNVRKLFHILLAPSERLGYTESSKKTAEPDSAVKMENKGVYKMELVTVREIYRNTEKYLNQKITVGGWLRSVRDSKTFGFLVLA